MGEILLGRWELQQLLGEGGTGSVFAARDLEQGGEVAVKVLTRASAGALYRLKNEFRSLSDVTHPNLVRLLELAHDAGRWFVVMELVRGVDFMSYVRAGECGYDLERLRRALYGLARGVEAIHGSSKLHRDLKPSNVLVAPDGHVVIVDFGLVSGQHLGDDGQTLQGVFSGTPAYAAPEQLAGLEQTPATDWYSVGVMLFEALTGRTARATLQDGARELPAPSRVAQVPPELDRLCLALLARDPAQRADGAAVRAALGDELAVASLGAAHSVGAHGDAAPFVGREAERAALAAAYRETRRGGPRVMLVHGPSGIGKSALVGRFVAELRDERALVLSGRCYAREKVPYKAFDAVVDQLSRYLSSLPELEVARLLPRDTPAMLRMFPTLARVPALLRPGERLGAEIDTQNERSRAFLALKELLARIADRLPLTVCIDDLQWGDVDSARLFCTLLAAPDAPAALFACTYRSEERDTSPILRELLADPDFVAASSELALPPLSVREARALVSSVDAGALCQIEAIVEEAKGSPFFLGELVRQFAVSRTLGRVSEVIAARVAALSPNARALLEVLCVAGRPVPATEALRAAAISDPTAARELGLAHLARTRSLGSVHMLEPYHDRVRESVGDAIDGERTRALNLALARSYERSEPLDAEALVQFYLRGGERGEAARFARAAADKAMGALAYARAAEFLEIACESPALANDPSVRVTLAEAYAKAGRPVEAAEAYERAGALRPSERAEVWREAMRLYLQAAHLQRGRELMRRICRELKLHYPRPRWLAAIFAVVGLVLHRSRKRLDTWRLSPARALPEPERRRLQGRFDLLWAAGTGLYGYTDGETLWFLSRALATARKLGSPESLPLVMVFDDLFDFMFRRRPDPARHERRIARALEVARASARPELEPMVCVYAGGIWAHEGDVHRAIELSDRADRILRERGLAGGAIVPLLRAGQLAFDFTAGRLTRSSRQLPTWLREAKESRDVYNEAVLGVVGAHHHLILDAPDAAHALVRHSFARAAGFEHPFSATYTWEAGIELYRGHPERVPELARRARRSPNYIYERSHAVRRVGRALIDGLAFTAQYLAQPDPELLRELERRIRALAWERLPCAAAARHHLLACRAHARREHEREREALLAARAGYQACGFGLYVPACNDRIGRVIGGDEGRTLVATTRAELVAQGVVNPERWLGMLSPVRA